MAGEDSFVLTVAEVRRETDDAVSVVFEIPADDAEAVAACAEFARMGESRPVYAACPRLADSIDAAVREGRVGIGAEDGW